MKRSMIAILLTVVIATVAANAYAMTFPDPSDTVSGVPVALPYGDFVSYSLPILEYMYTHGYITGGSFSVQSGPGHLSNYIAIYTGANGHLANTAPGNMDDAYDTPGGNYSSFSMATASDPGGAGEFTGDTAHTWDIELSALNNFLGTSQLFFFFNNNESNNEGDLRAWGRATLIDTATVNPLPPLVFDFNNNHSGPLVYSSTGAAPTTSDYAVSGNDVATIWGTFTHNLGADHAAYAVFSPELNAYAKNYANNGYDVLQGDFRLLDLSNGYEQLFIQKGHDIAPPTNNVPEPMSAMLLGLGLSGLAALRKRRA